MRCTARRTIVMLAGALTLCTTMISARGTGLDGEVGEVLAATSVETSVTAAVVGGQMAIMVWAAFAGLCMSCLPMIVSGTAPLVTVVSCAQVCYLAFG